jgi:hypothetical protein
MRAVFILFCLEYSGQNNRKVKGRVLKLKKKGYEAFIKLQQKSSKDMSLTFPVPAGKHKCFVRGSGTCRKAS